MLVPLKVPTPRRLLARGLIAKVLAWHGLALEDILPRTRAPHVDVARQDAIAAVVVAYPGMRLTVIGLLFNRHFSTIWHVVNKFGLRPYAVAGRRRP